MKGYQAREMPLTEGGHSTIAENRVRSPAPQQIFRMGELFAGAGGLAWGASRARFKNLRVRHIWANDIDKDACKTFEQNFPECKVIRKDVKNLDFSSLAPIDGLAFGFPCNDFSNVGERKGIGGHYGGLYTWGVKALRHFRPLFFIAENVGGLRSTNGRRDIELIMHALNDAGYNTHPELYRFEEHDVPQSRHRYIIVGFRKDISVCYKPPLPKKRQITCREALTKPPIPSNASNNERTVQLKTVIERLEHIKPGQNVFTADLPPDLQLNMKSGAYISQIYRRLDPNKPSYTITGSGGGGTHVYHWKEPRALTNRERARLQTFPDKFVFYGGKESVRKQIGMAVPPKGMQAIFNAVLRTLEHAGVKPKVK